MFAGPN